MSTEEKFSVSLNNFLVLSRGLLKLTNDCLEFLKVVPGEYFARLSKKYPNIYFLTTLSLTELAILFNFFSSDARAEGDEDLAKQLEARSAQEQFNDTVAQLQQMFVDLMGGPFGDFLMGLAEVVAFVGEIVMGFIGVFQWIGKLFSPIGKFIDKLGVAGKVLKGIARIAVVVAAYKTYKAVAQGMSYLGPGAIAAPIVAGAAAAAVMAMGFAALSSASAKANDAVFPGGGGGYGKRALLSEGSVTLFNDKDTIIAGTKLQRGDDVISEPEGTVRTAPVVAPPTPVILQNEVVYDSHNSANYYNGPRSTEKSETGIFT